MAVFTEAELKSTTPSKDLFSMLEGAVYLTQEESMIQPKLVPVKENSRLKGHTVRFEDVANLAESMDVDYLTAMQAIAECNTIDAQHLCVIVNESDIIIDPEICAGLKNIVVAPVSEDALGFAYTNAVIDAFMESEEKDEAVLEAAILECAFLDEFVDLKEEGEAAPQQDGKIAQAKATISKAWEAIKAAPGKGKNFVAEQIAALRRRFNEFMTSAKSEKDPNKAGMLKQLAMKLQSLINKLVESVKGAANAVKEKVMPKKAEAQPQA